MSMKTGWSLRRVLELRMDTFLEYHLAMMDPPQPRLEVDDKLEKLKRMNYGLHRGGEAS